MNSFYQKYAILFCFSSIKMWRLFNIIIFCSALSRSLPQGQEQAGQSCEIRNINGVGDVIGDSENFDAHVRSTLFGEWPNMCAVQRVVSFGLGNTKLTKEIYLSGGSLIAPNVILTAAHYVS